jgi:hypothetical protein
MNMLVIAKLLGCVKSEMIEVFVKSFLHPRQKCV